MKKWNEILLENYNEDSYDDFCTSINSFIKADHDMINDKRVLQQKNTKDIYHRLQFHRKNTPIFNYLLKGIKYKRPSFSEMDLMKVITASKNCNDFESIMGIDLVEMFDFLSR